MSYETVRVGELLFEFDEALDGHESVTVTKVNDLEGWVAFVRCPEDEIAWSNLRNNCYPFNGKEGPPPTGTWILYEYVGKESASLNLQNDRSPQGFTDAQILAVQSAVNLMFTETYRARIKRFQKEVNIIH